MPVPREILPALSKEEAMIEWLMAAALLGLAVIFLEVASS